MAVGTLVFDQSSYRNVLCLGHILAEDGRKMSKHLGNILEPIPLMDTHGADAVRWFMAAGGSPWALPAGGSHHDHRDRPQGADDLLEHGRVPEPVRPGQRLVAGLGCRRAGRGRPSGTCWTAGWSAARNELVPRGHRRAGGLRHPARRSAARRRSSTTCPTGTCGVRAAASGRAARTPWRPCTTPSTW